ncbi:hypothetical protein OQJ26_13380 [Legionella sp. PATHC038]|uniref:hypothetical protein n=1 Tax=Legionella sheltonii TaxID=2992041 RepID=UPI002242CCD0|nr:hypothetical protein [Legionella sp. PATHC038]MCW8399780.1 hypothetical protein [Legionella sp. PATHC038]
MAGTNSSTNRMITSLKPNAINTISETPLVPVVPVVPVAPAVSEAPTDPFISRLQKLNLGNNTRMVSLIQAHSNFGNRLISLFKALKEFKIDLTDDLECTIKENISQVGGVVSLLELIKKDVRIKLEFLPITLLFNAAKFEVSITQSIRDLALLEMLDSNTFNLLLAYPEQALNISILLIKLQERAYSPTILVDKLKDVSIAAERMDTVIALLDLILENNLFYPDVVDILLRQEKHIDKIYEGAQKLAAEKALFPNYFTIIEDNPQNANIFAKNILLLKSESLINCHNPECLFEVSHLGAGAFHFMKLLQHASMLDEHNFKIICGQKNNILNRDEVIDALSNLPLIVEFQKEELETMLNLLNEAAVSAQDIQKFNGIIEEHFIPEISCQFSRACI